MVRFFFAIVAALAWAPAHAELIERDWLATGDGLLTFNPATGREWLDITVTELQQYGDTVDDAVNTAKDLLAAGELLPGFVLADRAEVEDLLQAAGFSSEASPGENLDAVRSLVSLLEEELAPNDTGGLQAVIDETAAQTRPFSQPAYLAFVVTVGDASASRPGRASFTNNHDTYRQSSIRHTGMMVFRKAVPETSSIATVAVLSFCSLLRRRS